MHFQGNNEEKQKKGRGRKKVCIEGKGREKKMKKRSGNQCFYINFEASRKLDQNGLFAIDKKSQKVEKL